MRLPVVNTVEDVAERGLCCGCGACAYMDPEHVQMTDSLDHGRRPRLVGEASPEALRVCPGRGLEHTFDRAAPGLIRELLDGWGPVLEVWEGYAADETIRRAGSSGGAASAVALACIERGGMHGVLHIRARRDAPLLNETVLSTTRDEILAATGSRYAPASPCDGLAMIEAAPGPCVFVGKPCDAAAVHRARALRPALDARLGVTVAMFCAGTPSTKGTLELLARLGVDDPSDVVEVRYRGNGWPGRAVFTLKTARGVEARSLSYEESWGEVLTNHKQWRCRLCADHTGEFADVAVGDPWHRPIEPGDPGRSLVLARTPRGREVLADAVAAGYLVLERADPAILPASQPALLRSRGAAWGRRLGCRLMGEPVPRYRGLPLFRHWWALTPRQKARSIAGAVRRVRKRRRAAGAPSR